jgi:hypothetical protein
MSEQLDTRRSSFFDDDGRDNASPTQTGTNAPTEAPAESEHKYDSTTVESRDASPNRFFTRRRVLGAVATITGGAVLLGGGYALGRGNDAPETRLAPPPAATAEPFPNVVPPPLSSPMPSLAPSPEAPPPTEAEVNNPDGLAPLPESYLPENEGDLYLRDSVNSPERIAEALALQTAVAINNGDRGLLEDAHYSDIYDGGQFRDLETNMIEWVQGNYLQGGSPEDSPVIFERKWEVINQQPGIVQLPGELYSNKWEMIIQGADRIVARSPQYKSTEITLPYTITLNAVANRKLYTSDGEVREGTYWQILSADYSQMEQVYRQYIPDYFR